MAFSHLLLLRINQIMFARCLYSKSTAQELLISTSLRVLQKSETKFTPRPRSSLLFSQVYVQTEKKKEKQHLEGKCTILATNKRVCAQQSCVPYLYLQQYMNVKVDWREGRSQTTKSFASWAACLRERVVLS